MEYVGNIIYDKLLTERDRELVIFGAGKFGRKIYEFLKRNGMVCNIQYFCDSNEALWGKRFAGIEIVNPAWLFADSDGYHFLVGGNFADEVTAYLLENGVRKIHLLFM